MEDGYCKVYPTNGYGNPDVVREIIELEKPELTHMIYTDPRFWVWLFDMEHELRQNIPIFYYNIWDDLYQCGMEFYYESCDLIMNISKQTHNIVQNVCQNKPRTDWDSTYIPHGINEKFFYPIENEKEKLEMNKMKNELFEGKDTDFSMLYINRNIRRKMTSDTIMRTKTFANQLPKEKRDKVTYSTHNQLMVTEQIYRKQL